MFSKVLKNHHNKMRLEHYNSLAIFQNISSVDVVFTRYFSNVGFQDLI